MRIAVLSDTHDRLPPEVVARVAEADEVWHLGDVTDEPLLVPLRQTGRPLRVVLGNCDLPGTWPLTLRFSLAGQEILLVHIPPRQAPPGTHLLLHGHTHVPRDERIGSTRYLNPGCITRPNRGAPASFAWLTLEPGREPEWSVELV